MPRKLKVFRTPIGFHDAYVAVPTKKAALEAWGSSANLFARGVAEEVTDPTLTKAALATPGEVVKVPRGTAAEHVAALGKVAVPRRHPSERSISGPFREVKGRKKEKLKPKPKRDRLDAAEAALVASEEEQHAAMADLLAREKALAEERRKLERAQSAERAKLEKAREAADAAYRRALEKWRG